MSIYILKSIGKIHWPYSHKLTTGNQFEELLTHVIPGSILLSHIRGELTNFGIPGFWKHAAIVATDKKNVVEAIGEGVGYKRLDEFFYKKDFVGLYYPTFCSKEIMKEASFWAESKVDAPYDFKFEGSDIAFCCIEIVVDSYHAVMDGKCPFKYWDGVTFSQVLKRKNRLIAYPNDIDRAKEKFRKII